MKKIVVNKDTCIGCGACIAIDDAHFTFDEDGKSKVISQENIESVETTNAIESCPVAAITIEEANGNDEEVEETACEKEDCSSCNGQCHQE